MSWENACLGVHQRISRNRCKDRLGQNPEIMADTVSIKIEPLIAKRLPRETILQMMYQLRSVGLCESQRLFF